MAAAWLGWLPRSGYSDITQLAAYTTPRVVLSEEKTAAIYATQYSPLNSLLLVSEFEFIHGIMGTGIPAGGLLRYRK